MKHRISGYKRVCAPPSTPTNRFDLGLMHAIHTCCFCGVMASCVGPALVCWPLCGGRSKCIYLHYTL